ncbi:MAG: UDP-N-acetylmuramoyl-tripeptide--D-alanyl-D-alanine ligase [Peptoniphilaceae bacterium]|nr:UDP-N-acetylmuramoyl-tripeptide--D-alanyl-D-alanine ligase [Peptoniphilaceae bacterium]MDY6018090.1 UDP-N-acetylmuramoyl-tripeptide--D-alanyl-D-alanine ligase [Anaerococcus sp.]
MIERSLGQIAKMLNAVLADPNSSGLMIKGVTTDSRTVEKGNLYIPLIGEKFDGRIFIKECQDAGASAFLVDKDFKITSGIKIPHIIVDDTKKALQDLARAYKDQLDIKTIAITGSNGKTTTKNIMASVLASKYKVEKTKGNLNNDIGLPKTILSLNEDTQIGILEMGTDNFGDISLLTNIARPDIAIIMNIGDSHLENLKTKEGIAKAKLEILEGLKEDGIFIYNGDDPTLKKVLPQVKIKQKVISFGQNEDVDFRVKAEGETRQKTSFSKDGNLYSVPLLGSHQVYNGACCLLIGEIFGLSYDEINYGLLNVTSEANRNALIECHGFDILDDAYKSNPQSLHQGLETTKILGGYVRKIAVLGDMLELGDNEKELHYQAGKDIDPNDIEYVLCYGRLSKYICLGALENFPKNRVKHFDNKDDLIDYLKLLIIKSSLVFVKGSRGMHMEEVIESIKYLRV